MNDVRKLIVGECYQLCEPINMVAKLERVDTYPASGMPYDFMWSYVAGDSFLLESAKTCPINIGMEDILIPLPEFIMTMIKVELFDQEAFEDQFEVYMDSLPDNLKLQRNDPVVRKKLRKLFILEEEKVILTNKLKLQKDIK